MQKLVENVIIGAGFSGIICAIELSKAKKEVLLLERNDRVCKKIPSTGNGRGNITNLELGACNYHGSRYFSSYS
ncbi:MAG: NAD(P)/FAD-dependent oxidoreductase, partial [Clostridia bacterium]|nr:NAD(P)/FAD-dependent oxidoreductase [Clostridia bacterium]